MGRRPAAVPLAAARLLPPPPPVTPPAPPPSLLLLLLLAVQNARFASAAVASASSPAVVGDAKDVAPEVERLVRRWAPLVWLAPGERFFPGSVSDFLRHVTPRPRHAPSSERRRAADAATWFLVTNDSIDELVQDESSFLFGRDPSAGPVPVYALVSACEGGADGGGARRPERVAPKDTPATATGTPRFHVTYWMFYPFSQGKAVCSMDLGPLGVWPLPLLAGVCLGSYRDFGSHVGDWEHVSLLFQENASSPDALYLSAHDAGAFYRPSGDGRRFLFERQEVRRGLLQRPTFPGTVRLAPAPAPAPALAHSAAPARGPRNARASDAAGRPELFAARGSHGLWAAPGTHRYVRLPRLYDHSGYGTPWATWRALRVLHGAARRGPGWLAFRGRWGNPRSKCHPLARLGLALCQFTDGPTGIPLKEPHFRCDG